ncbi:hypothetical protein DNTS_012141 [Danionella cerebrum]|uniref:Elongator complex protein 6 n=1 Tax=Danionella cerebrum TaxID=2873325 RepID=A0A553Q8V6_9TELE|nr:hypothetical protein DNTS_012141 [Danionella translucida]
MFVELNSILNSTPDNFKQGDFTLVSDRQADASFLVHHYLSFYLRAGCKVCFLGLVQSFSHYSVVAQRLGVNLSQAREKGQLVFLEALKESVDTILKEDSSQGTQALSYLWYALHTVPNYSNKGQTFKDFECRSPGAGLEGLFRFVKSSLCQSEDHGPPVLIVDDLSVLLSLGVGAGAILDFTLYCQAAVCSELQGNVVIMVRCEQEEDDEEGSNLLHRGLLHQCSLALHVEGLHTGYCRDIHGQMEVWWRPGGETVYNQRRRFHFKVHDKGASFFAPGTSRAVL